MAGRVSNVQPASHIDTAQQLTIVSQCHQKPCLTTQAEDWYKEGGKLLVDIARKTTKIGSPEEARRLRTEISLFLSTGQQQQEQRINSISVMAEQLYGTAFR